MRFYNKNTVLQATYFIIMALLLAVVSLINFVELSFDVERLLRPTFWVQYIITLTVGLFSFFMTVASEKMKKRESDEIKVQMNTLQAYFNYITNNDGLYKKFKDYLDKENASHKLKMYTNKLKREREKARTEERVNEIDKKLETASTDFEYQDIKYTKKTVNLIFSGFATQDDGEYLKYTGREGMTEYLLPAVMVGVIITALTLAFTMSDGSSSLDKIIQLVTRIASIGSYIFKAGDYADYSIFTVYRSAIENRKGVVQCFLDEIGYKVSIENNTVNNYKIVEGEDDNE